MKTKFLAAFALLAVASGAAPANAGPTGPDVQIPPGGTLRGRFAEVHTFQSGKSPIQSEGSFTIAPGYGILWNIEKPLPITAIITPSGMTQMLGTFRLPSMPSSAMPIIGQGPALLTDALTGHWQNLDAQFAVTTQPTPAGWQAILASRPAANLPFGSIIAEGGHFVNTAHVTRNDGGQDNFVFLNQTVSAAPLSPNELAEFKMADTPQ